MTVNSRLRELYPESEELFDIVLMTNNHAQVGVRLINSINHYGKQNILYISSPHCCKIPNSTRCNVCKVAFGPLLPSVFDILLMLMFVIVWLLT